MYGAYQRILQECKNNIYLREKLTHETLIEKLDELFRTSPEIAGWLVDQLEDEYMSSNDVAEEYRKSLETKLERLSMMDDRLYDDKLAGDITKELYEAKHKSILKQIQVAKDDLAIADQSSDFIMNGKYSCVFRHIESTFVMS